MKAVVFYTSECEASLDAVCNELDGASCLYSLKEIYSDSEKTIQEQFLPFPEDTTHLIFIFSEDSCGLELLCVFIFFSGYCLGRNLRAVVINAGVQFPVPDRFKSAATFVEAGEFSSFLRTETERLKKEEGVSAARARLLAMGVSCFAENFFKCAEDGNAGETALFLQAGFDANLKDMRGNSVLTLAVRGGSKEVVGMLLNAGADINAVSGDRGYSPLMDAVHTKRTDLAAFLLENGADPNIRGRDSQTAVCIAAGRGDVDTCRLLMDYKADPSIPDALGMSAAGYAKLFHNDELCRLFNP